ncbi:MULTISPECIES: DUF3159 domain-containing protein [unclassified Actinotalea]|uniref:DUF3159 domain-containing protein n=1 Tax=unclassified Actinotalea TaxID=2638618 RepID=UPI0015F5EA19|nr:MULTISPECIES: DUF3159 domain-containing protein [unclassified Actinotalea]
MSSPAGEPESPQAERARSGVAPGRGVTALAADEFSFADAVGGWRGVVESGAPGLLFVVVFVATRELVPALVVALGLALLAVVVRLAQRTPATQAFSGVLGVAIGVVWAWRTGEAQDYFAWGLWVNVAWCVGAVVSVLARWPAVGVVVSLLRGQDMSWRVDAGAAALRRRYVLATWLWAVLFGARLAVQLPLYLQGADAVGWLGTARLVMGVPLFALGLWLTWLLVGSPRGRAEQPDRPATPPR